MENPRHYYEFWADVIITNENNFFIKDYHHSSFYFSYNKVLCVEVPKEPSDYCMIIHILYSVNNDAIIFIPAGDDAADNELIKNFLDKI